jgi:hypothetical protein
MMTDVFLLAILIITLICIVYRSKESFSPVEPTGVCDYQDETGKCWAWKYTCPEGWHYNGYGACIKNE